MRSPPPSIIKRKSSPPIRDLAIEGTDMPTISANVRKISGNRQKESISQFLRKREEGLGLRSSSGILGRIKKREVDQEEFNYAIKEARDIKNNARLNFRFCDLREVTFKTTVDETNEIYILFKESCFIGATFKDEADLSELSFENANFSHAKLSQANLTGAKLTGTDLTGADLNNATLHKAYLILANLTGANLKGANLKGAKFIRTDLTKADLTGADLSWVDLTEEDLTGANLTGANLNGTNLSGAKLNGAKVANVIQASINEETIPIPPQFYKFLNALDKAQRKEILGTGDTSASNYLQNLLNRLTAGSYSQQHKKEINELLNVVKSFEKELKGEIESNPSPDLQNPNQSKAHLTGTDLSWADLSGLDLFGADLSGKNLARADLCGAYLTIADLSGADLTWANFTRAKLNGADLTGANLNGAHFTGADLTGAKVANVIQASINEETKTIHPKFYEFLNALDKAQRKEILGSGDTSASKYLQNLKNKLTDNPSKITQIDKLLNVVKSFEKKLKGEIESPPSPNPQNPRLSRLERTFGGTGCSIS